MRRRFLGLGLSVLVHLGLIAAVVALVRTTEPPVLFVDLAHGLDLAEDVVSDLRRAMADVRARVLPRAGAPRAKSDGAPRSAASAETPTPPAAPEPVRPAPEPVRPTPEPSPPVASATPEPQPQPEPRVVELPPVASAAGDSVASSSTTERTTAPAAGGSGGRGASSAGAAGANAGDGNGQASAGVRSGVRDGSGVALAIPGAGGGDPAAADYAGYYATLRQRLYDSVTYPAIARRRGLTGTVVVDVEVDASGKVGRVTVVTSSKHAVLDDAALNALHGVGKVPFPPGVPPRRLLVRLPVVFDLR